MTRSVLDEGDPRGVWWLPSPNGEGTVVWGAHPEGQCASGHCALHRPSRHWARGMPLRWVTAAEAGAMGYRGGQPVMQRLCPHGAWHDDPDDLSFRRGFRDYRPREGFEPDCGCDCSCDLDAPF